jgi:PAS domain S-box-containing protein
VVTAPAGFSFEVVQRVIQASPSAAALTRMGDSRFLDANEEKLEMLGYARDELVGKTAAELGVWRDAPLKSLVETLKREGRARRVAIPFYTKDGHPRHCLASLDVVIVDGQPCLVSTCVDVSELRRESERIRSSEERFRKAFEDAPIGMVLFDGRGTYLQVNHAFETMLGRTAEEIVGRDWKEFTHPDDIAPVTQRGQAVAAQQRAPNVRLEKRYLRADGAVVWAELTSSAIRDAEGNVVQFVTQVQDVTAQRQAMEALRGQTMARGLVRRLLVSVIHRGKVNESVVREMGRELARENMAPTIEDALRAFRELGFGELSATRQDGHTFAFAGHDLLERRASSAHPTCYLALSYLEGAVANATGAAASLGSEIRCQSQGHETCVFIVVRRDAKRS